MKRTTAAVLAAFLLLGGCAATAQMVTVSGSKLKDAAGNTLTGTATFQPVDENGSPISFRFGDGGQGERAVISPVPITNGAFSVTLPDTALTSPAPLCLMFTARAKDGSVVIGGKGHGYDCLQPSANNAWCSAGVCNLDNYTPNLPALSQSQIIPQANVTGLVPALAGKLAAASNLSDVPSASTARANLGLGTAATHAATDFDTAGAAATVQTSLASEVTRATAAEATKANDSAVVHTSGDETVAGNKTFTGALAVGTTVLDQKGVLTPAITVPGPIAADALPIQQLLLGDCPNVTYGATPNIAYLTSPTTGICHAMDDGQSGSIDYTQPGHLSFVIGSNEVMRFYRGSFRFPTATELVDSYGVGYLHFTRVNSVANSVTNYFEIKNAAKGAYPVFTVRSYGAWDTNVDTNADLGLQALGTGVVRLLSPAVLAAGSIATTQSAGDHSTNVATTEYVDAGLATKVATTAVQDRAHGGTGADTSAVDVAGCPTGTVRLPCVVYANSWTGQSGAISVVTALTNAPAGAIYVIRVSEANAHSGDGGTLNPKVTFTDLGGVARNAYGLTGGWALANTNFNSIQYSLSLGTGSNLTFQVDASSVTGTPSYYTTVTVTRER